MSEGRSGQIQAAHVQSWIVGEKFERVVGGFKETSGHGFFVLSDVAVDRLQIAEHILTLIVTNRHQAVAMMR